MLAQAHPRPPGQQEPVLTAHRFLVIAGEPPATPAHPCALQLRLALLPCRRVGRGALPKRAAVRCQVPGVRVAGVARCENPGSSRQGRRRRRGGEGAGRGAGCPERARPRALDLLRCRVFSRSRREITKLLTRTATAFPRSQMGMGALAGCTAALATTPFDVVKTRLQTQAALGPAAAAQQGGVIETLRGIVQAEGPGGLYRRGRILSQLPPRLHPTAASIYSRSFRALVFARSLLCRGLAPRLVIYALQGGIFFTSYRLAQALLPATDGGRHGAAAHCGGGGEASASVGSGGTAGGRRAEAGKRAPLPHEPPPGVGGHSVGSLSLPPTALWQTAGVQGVRLGAAPPAAGATGPPEGIAAPGWEAGAEDGTESAWEQQPPMQNFPASAVFTDDSSRSRRRVVPPQAAAAPVIIAAAAAAATT